MLHSTPDRVANTVPWPLITETIAITSVEFRYANSQADAFPDERFPVNAGIVMDVCDETGVYVQYELRFPSTVVFTVMVSFVGEATPAANRSVQPPPAYPPAVPLAIGAAPLYVSAPELPELDDVRAGSTTNATRIATTTTMTTIAR